MKETDLAGLSGGDQMKGRAKINDISDVIRLKVAELRSTNDLSALCLLMKEVHGWDPMVEIWTDRFGTQRIALNYSEPTDAEDDEFRVFAAIDNLAPRLSFYDLRRLFVHQCTEGLE